ncbi:MAG: CpaF family protein [Eggerthella lenta]
MEFDDAEHVRRIINKIAEQSGKRCDDAHAMGCAMLPGGRARATYVVPPIAPDGPALNVRTFSSSMLGMEDLVRMGMLTDGMSQFLRAAVQARCPLVISGGTGSGKTTLLGALSGFIPPDERVITIEDTPELRLQTPHVERMQTREANTEGEGSVSMRELVALSLRRRPDRIIVGECRGAEAYDMLQAMQTDHPGSMTTVHANDPGNAISRLRTMVATPTATSAATSSSSRLPSRCRAASSCTSNACKTPPSDQHRGDRSASRREPRHPACRAVRFRRRGRRCVRRRRGRVARVRRAAPAHQGAHARIGRMVRPRLVFRSMRRAEA